MAELREIRRRIKSVENTRKITRAMEMVAGAKLKQLEVAATRARPYTEGLKKLLSRLLAENPGLKHPLFEEREEVKRSALIFVTSDTGLCGSYNADLIKEAERFVELRGRENIELIAVGLFGMQYFQNRGLSPNISFTDFRARVESKGIERVLKAASDLFISRRVDEVIVISCYFRSASSFGPRRMRFFPHHPHPSQRDEEADSPTAKMRVVGLGLEVEPGSSNLNAYPALLEPARKDVFDALVPRFLEGELRQILLEAFSAEQSARMMAMRNATENADDMIKGLTLTRNKARQAQITRDIIEVVSGAEGLKQ